MKQAAANTTTKSSRGNKDARVLGTLGRDLIDTAWRMAVPVILFAVLGIILDKSLGTAPWLTLAFTAAGFFVAGWLVKRQLAKVEREDNES